MATATVIKKENDITFFKLSNMPALVCKINTEDFYEFVDGSTAWYVHISGHKSSHRYYIRKNSGNKTLHLHREVTRAGEFSHDNVVDHDDGDGLNNTKKNLIVTDTLGNVRNARGRRRMVYRDIFIHTTRRTVKLKSGEKKYLMYRAQLRGFVIGERSTVEKIFKDIDNYWEKQKPPV